MLTGYPIAVSQFMAGAKRAVLWNGTIYLSPAMYDLISHAEGEELERLLAAIRLLELPDYRLDSLDLTVSPPNPDEEFRRDIVMQYRINQRWL